jgi:hypothetical protein
VNPRKVKDATGSAGAALFRQARLRCSPSASLRFGLSELRSSFSSRHCDQVSDSGPCARDRVLYLAQVQRSLPSLSALGQLTLHSGISASGLASLDINSAQDSSNPATFNAFCGLVGGAWARTGRLGSQHAATSGVRDVICNADWLQRYVRIDSLAVHSSTCWIAHSCRGA